ncbi:MAG TPA: LuxR family transcriptional regulator [Gaiellaceae bacterium]|nr:LuxR family transcriptional regulator [Gaiellaceae bacterium]
MQARHGESEPLLLGRDPELALIASACEAAAGGGAAVVLVGEPGIGKSALLASVAGDGSRNVLRARGVDAERTVAFATLQALLWPLRGSLDEVAPQQAALLRSILALGPPADATTFSVGAATLALLSACSRERPLVAVVDDAHLADAATQDVLAFVARRIEPERVVLLAAARTDEPCALVADGAFVRIDVAGLAPADARALLARSSPPGLADVVAEQLLARCRGNPLGLLELPRSLTSAQLRGDEPLAPSIAGGPELQRAFAERVEQVSETARSALLLLAAAGDPDAALRAMDEDECAGLAEAERAHVVARGATTEFVHPLLEAAVYGAASADDRRAAHRRIANVVEGPRRAWHLAQAVEGPSDEAAGALEDAAEEARALGGAAAQAQALERAAELTPDDELRAGRLLRAANAWREAGRVDHAQELLTTALDHAREPRTRWAIQLERGGNLERTTAYRESYELLLGEARSAEQADPAAAARLYAAVTLVVNQYRDAGVSPLEPAERAVELAGHSGDEVELEALFALVTARMNRLPPDERDDEILARAARLLEQRELRARERPHWIAYALAEHERDDAARRLSDVALAETRAVGDVWSHCYGLFARAAIELALGRIDLARTWAFEAIPLADQIGEQWRREQAEAVRVEVDAARGCVAECEAAFVDESHAHSQLHLGRALLAQARFEESVRRLELANEALSQGSPRYWYRWIPLDLAEAYAAAGRRRDAERVLREVRPLIERARLARPQARLARVAAWLAPEARIDAAFAEALGFLEATPHHLEHARVELNWGERLRRSGRSEDAVPHLERALARFEALGATGWSERARSEIAEVTGTRPAASARRTDVLTPQELRVARHASVGMRDREIAAALYLSPRTVESYLHSAYSKLGISNRTQLAGILAADGVSAAAPAGEP